MSTQQRISPSLSPKFSRIETWRQEVAAHPIPPPLAAPEPGTWAYEDAERAPLSGRGVTCADFWRLPVVVRVRGVLVRSKRKRAVKTRMYESSWEGTQEKEKGVGFESDDEKRGGLLDKMERFARAKRLLERGAEKGV